MFVRLWPVAFAIGLLIGAPAVDASRPATGNTILAEAPGPMLAQALRQVYALSPAASGQAVSFAAWSGTLQTLQQRAASANVGADVLLMPNADLLAACRQGLLIPLDRAVAERSASVSGVSTCGLPAFYEATVLAWDETRDHTPPEWPNFWDVARYPGRRGLPRHARGTLEVALMADGVAARDVYRVLASSEGVARAFHKLDQLRPYIVWWDDGEKAIKALEAGSVMMTMAPATFAAGLVGARAPAIGQQWADGLIETLGWAVPVGALDPRAGMAFLRSEPDPARQTVLAGLLPVDGADPVPAPAANRPAASGDAGARLKHMFRIDDLFWLDHSDLSRRFDTWLAVPR